jgi:hypothetical protein
MNKTFQQLCLDAGESEDEALAFDAALSAKITDAAKHLDGMLKPGLDARAIAADAIDNAIARGGVNGDTVNLEIAARYALDGHPISAAI